MLVELSVRICGGGFWEACFWFVTFDLGGVRVGVWWVNRGLLLGGLRYRCVVNTGGLWVVAWASCLGCLSSGGLNTDMILRNLWFLLFIGGGGRLLVDLFARGCCLLPCGVALLGMCLVWGVYVGICGVVRG